MKFLRFFTPLVLALALSGCHKENRPNTTVDVTNPSPNPVTTTDTNPITQGVGVTGSSGLGSGVTGAATASNSAEDEAIINAVIANGESEETDRSVQGDRAVVFGNNYPGTPAELHECVNDARKNVLNLVRFEHFNPKNIRIFLNEKCTKANYEKWTTWVIANADTGPQRRAFFNSSHGAEDTDANGNTVDVIVTHDMIAKNQWDETTEVSAEFWSKTLRTTKCNFFVLNDCCHSGGDMRAAMGALSRSKGKMVRSVEGPAPVKLRIEKSVKSISQRQQLSALTGTIIPACQASELSEESSNFGGAATECYWRARKVLPAEAKSGDIVREANRLLRENQFSQHMGLIGVNRPLWSQE